MAVEEEGATSLIWLTALVYSGHFRKKPENRGTLAIGPVDGSGTGTTNHSKPLHRSKGACREEVLERSARTSHETEQQTARPRKRPAVRRMPGSAANALRQCQTDGQRPADHGKHGERYRCGDATRQPGEGLDAEPRRCEGLDKP